MAGEDVDSVADEIFELSNQVETRGGGPLFGVNGVSVVGHGAARAEAVKRAIGMAKLAVDTGFVSQMYQDLESVHARLEEQ
jgi:fatty acid/phospholipid biosynthesis enzyme